MIAELINVWALDLEYIAILIACTKSVISIQYMVYVCICSNANN